MKFDLMEGRKENGISEEVKGQGSTLKSPPSPETCNVKIQT